MTMLLSHQTPEHRVALVQRCNVFYELIACALRCAVYINEHVLFEFAARIMSEPLVNEVRFLFRTAGGMLEYETWKSFDMLATHDSYSTLRLALNRPGKVISLILHDGTPIKDDESHLGIILRPHKRLLVVYHDFDVSPVSYTGFQE
jgi:hypothetical protein